MGGGAASAHRAAGRGSCCRSWRPSSTALRRAVDLDRRAARPAGAGARRCRALLALRFRHAVHHVSARRRAARAGAARAGDADGAHRARAGRQPAPHALRDRFRATGRSPADEIRRLARLVDILSSGHNQIFAPDLRRCCCSARSSPSPSSAGARGAARGAASGWRPWRSTRRSAALATYAAEHAEDPFPEIVDGAAAASTGDALAHPLLPVDTAVPNDVRLGADRSRTCCSSAARTCRARARCSGRSASTRCSRRPARPVRARRLTHDAARDWRDAADSGLAAGGPVAVLRRDHPDQRDRRR